MDIQTTIRTELIDITDRVRAIVTESGIKDGICIISTRAIPQAVIINENERGLRGDILEMLETLIPENKSYAYNRIDNKCRLTPTRSPAWQQRDITNRRWSSEYRV